MPQYKLHYFNLRARGELARILFAAAGVEFEDHRISNFQEWASAKPTFPFQQVPVLEVDGKLLPQSNAISVFLAEEFGLSGKNAFEKAQSLVIMEALRDLIEGVDKVGLRLVPGVGPEVNPEPDAELLKGYKEKVSKQLPLLDKYIQDNFKKEGFAVGQELLLGDLALVATWEVLEPITSVGISELLAAHAPTLQAHREKVLEIPRLKAYLAARPVTKF